MLCLFFVELSTRHISAPSNPFHQCHSPGFTTDGFIAILSLLPNCSFTNFRPFHLLLREISPPLNTNSSTRKTNPSMSLHPPIHIYTDGSCPDQVNVSPHNLAGWGFLFESIRLDLCGPVGFLPFTVKGSSNTAEFQAPLKAIAVMLLHPPFPPHYFLLGFPLRPKFVQWRSLPSANLELTILLADFCHRLRSNFFVKVKSRT